MPSLLFLCFLSTTSDDGLLAAVDGASTLGSRALRRSNPRISLFSANSISLIVNSLTGSIIVNSLTGSIIVNSLTGSIIVNSLNALTGSLISLIVCIDSILPVLFLLTLLLALCS